MYFADNVEYCVNFDKNPSSFTCYDHGCCGDTFYEYCCAEGDTHTVIILSVVVGALFVFGAFVICIVRCLILRARERRAATARGRTVQAPITVSGSTAQTPYPVATATYSTPQSYGGQVNVAPVRHIVPVSNQPHAHVVHVHPTSPFAPLTQTAPMGHVYPPAPVPQQTSPVRPQMGPPSPQQISPVRPQIGAPQPQQPVYIQSPVYPPGPPPPRYDELDL